MRWGKRLLVFLTSLLIIALHMIPIYITVVASFKDIRDFSSKWFYPSWSWTTFEWPFTMGVFIRRWSTQGSSLHFPS